MKLQKFPILVAAILGVLSVSTPDLWAHGGGRSGGGHFGGTRFGGGHFVGRPAFVGQRFNRFANRRGFNNVVVAGSYGYNYYPYGYYSPSAYAPYANNAYPDYSAAPPPVAAYANLSPGLVAGDVVGNVQRVLKYRGFYNGPIDGLSGPTTRAASRAYDTSVGLPPTGIIDARLLISMQLM